MGLHARGIDDRPIQIEHSVKSISQEITFDRDISDQQRLENILRDLSIQVGFRLRADKLTASTVRIKLRWPDFTSHTRQLTLPQPADQDGVIFETACRLFHSLWLPGRAVRLLGVGASGLATDTYQPSLWDTPSEKERRLLHALDDLQAKFGEGAVHRGGVVSPRRRPPQG
jgi:DNA polymerase-4